MSADQGCGFYPVFLRLSGRPCLVVGGGRVAERKVGDLLECGAAVTVVAPAAVPGLERAAREGRLRRLARGFEEADLEGVFLAVVATDTPELNQRIHQLAEARGVPVNVVDQPELCSFIVPAVVRRGEFQLAVSTGGASPVLARKVKEELERMFPERYGLIVRELEGIREQLKARVPAAELRKKFWERFVDLEYFAGLAEDQIARRLNERMQACLSQLED